MNECVNTFRSTGNSGIFHYKSVCPWYIINLDRCFTFFLYLVDLGHWALKESSIHNVYYDLLFTIDLVLFDFEKLTIHNVGCNLAFLLLSKMPFLSIILKIFFIHLFRFHTWCLHTSSRCSKGIIRVISGQLPFQVAGYLVQAEWLNIWYTHGSLRCKVHFRT